MYRFMWIFVISSDEDLEHVLDIIAEHNRAYVKQLVIKNIVQNRKTKKYYLRADTIGDSITQTLAILRKIKVKMYTPLETPSWWTDPIHYQVFWSVNSGKVITSPFQ